MRGNDFGRTWVRMMVFLKNGTVSMGGQNSPSEKIRSGARGQISTELIMVISMMVALLLVVLLVNINLQLGWAEEKQSLEASAAANQLALAINRAAAGGSSTKISFTNTVGPDVTNVSVFDKRSVRAHYAIGGYASAGLVTNNTNIAAQVPINRQITVINTGGVITVE